nr:MULTISPECIES: alcohol dehydrogenase catalytic domain-containing protein [unclassified Rathayibacter]
MPAVPGRDAVGVVDEVGADVTGTEVGDVVFGLGVPERCCRVRVGSLRLLAHRAEAGSCARLWPWRACRARERRHPSVSAGRAMRRQRGVADPSAPRR